jgi:hypothetical protein
MRLTLDKQGEFARELVKQLSPDLGSQLVDEILNADQSSEAGIRAQRERITVLKSKLSGKKDLPSKELFPWPTNWSASPSGSSAVTVGRTISVTVVWITSLPAAVM